MNPFVDSTTKNGAFNPARWIFPPTNTPRRSGKQRRYRVRALANVQAKTWLFIISDTDRVSVAYDGGELPTAYPFWNQTTAELYGLAQAHRWLTANVGNGFEVVMVNTTPRQESRRKARAA
jgi:hypothetical protein